MQVTPESFAGYAAAQFDSPEGAALALAQENSVERRRGAVAERRQSRQEVVRRMQQVADTLRKMAGMTIGSSVWRGVGLAASACATIVGRDALAVGCRAAAEVDGFGMVKTRLEADRGQLAAWKAEAEYRQQDADERASSAGKLVDRQAQQLERLLRSRHQGAMALL